MLDTVRNYLGLKTPQKRTNIKTINNSLLIIAGFGLVVLTPTLLVHIDQANQLLQMQTTIEEGFTKIDETVNTLQQTSNIDHIKKTAAERLGLTTVEIEQ